MAKHILSCSFGKDSIATALLALQHGEPLWKAMHVEAGWEDAVEAVLRERLAALPAASADAAWSRDRPCC